MTTALNPRILQPHDIEPNWQWDRHLPALGHTAVDFERRVDHDRLRRYRLSRAKQALKNSDCGALLLFDVNNIRYVTGTKIGEWERDKMCRFALLAGDDEPFVWDLSKAAIRLGVNYIGLFDELALFNRALAAAEVEELNRYFR